MSNVKCGIRIGNVRKGLVRDEMTARESKWNYRDRQKGKVGIGLWYKGKNKGKGK